MLRFIATFLNLTGFAFLAFYTGNFPWTDRETVNGKHDAQFEADFYNGGWNRYPHGGMYSGFNTGKKLLGAAVLSVLALTLMWMSLAFQASMSGVMKKAHFWICYGVSVLGLVLLVCSLAVYTSVQRCDEDNCDEMNDPTCFHAGRCIIVRSRMGRFLRFLE